MNFNNLVRNFCSKRYFIQTFRLYSSKSQSVSPIDYCLDLVRKNDYENFLCALLLPKTPRNAIISVRAFNVEVSKAAIASKDSRISLMRLGFWNETIAKIYEGNPPNHPVAIQLARTISKHDLKKRNFMRLVKAREVQLTEPCFQSLDNMEKYSEETVSPIIYMSLEVAGIKDINADHAASHVGKGQGLVMLLRIARSGNSSWSLPRDLLESVGFDVAKGLLPHSSSTKDLVFKIASRAKAHIDKARSLSSKLPRGSSVYLLPAIPTANYLRRLSPSTVFH
ncbi:NADH dehydrogenase (ubiquinone) complex I, assembly factor 6 isoform X2 [Halyomorpha halys]|uniref:NADH dehydrogenase (ubiquinone) complex I, assembly factor 6 isoform X2 n=1 Tax=Halyomorpha halys TaxID=286706 RepID=UPI0006D5230C|nr:NADH dehydrogenase (ubiquinone) complex I, assembly factor 6 isoform X2 [Halyomorpha halys]